MDYKDLTLLTTKGVVKRLAQESECGAPAMNYNQLKSLSQRDYPFIIRRQITPGSKKPRVFFIYEFFKIWLLEGNTEMESAINQCRPQISKFLDSLIKKRPGRPARKLSIVGGTK